MCAASYAGITQQNKGCSLNVNRNQLQNSYSLYPTTGNAQLDQIINLDMFALYDLFDVKANIYMYKDDNGPNARALPIVSDQRFPDGTVIFGINLMGDEFRKSATGLGFAIPGIIAHEMGHILQFNKKSNMPVMQMELQADFLAGYYLSVRTDLMRNKGIPVYTFAPEAFKSFFEKGGYDFNNPSHHGTPEQRLAAVTAGHNCNFRDIDEIFDASKKYVQKYINNSPGSSGSPFYPGNSNSNSTNVTMLQKLIDVFKNERFNEIEGAQIVGEEPESDETKQMFGDCNNYNSKLIFTDAVETRISSCQGGISKSSDQVTKTYYSTIVDIFNTDDDLAMKKFDEWTKTIIKATGSLDFREKKEDGKYDNTTSRNWRVTTSSKTVKIMLDYEKSTTHNLSSVKLTIY